MGVSGIFRDRVSIEVKVRCHPKEDHRVRLVGASAGKFRQLVRHPNRSVLLEAVALDCLGVIK